MSAVRVLVVSNLYPPVVRGGYEVECSGVVDRLRERHEVHVLASVHRAGEAPPQAHVTRSLPFLEEGTADTLRAPLAARRAIAATRDALDRVGPDLVWVWNAAGIPQTAIRVLADSGVPLAFRVCEHWFARVLAHDRFTAHLRGGETGPRDRAWGAAMRALNAVTLRYDPDAPVRAAISWNSEAIRRMAPAPAAIEPILERVVHSTSRKLPELEAVVRAPDPEPLALFLGRRDALKGADVLVRAIGRLRREHGIAVRTILAGPASADDPGLVARVAAEAGVEDLVGELPPQDSGEVAALLARAHVLVVPSTWAEPYPLVSIEGAAADVPLVASSAGGIPEFVGDGVEGLLFAPGDDAGCARALAAVLTDPDAARERARVARARAHEHDWDAYLDASERFALDAVEAWRARS